MRNDCAYIEIRGLQVSQQKAHRFRIDALYIPLTTVNRLVQDALDLVLRLVDAAYSRDKAPRLWPEQSKFSEIRREPRTGWRRQTLLSETVLLWTN